MNRERGKGQKRMNALDAIFRFSHESLLWTNDPYLICELKNMMDLSNEVIEWTTVPLSYFLLRPFDLVFINGQQLNDVEWARLYELKRAEPMAILIVFADTPPNNRPDIIPLRNTKMMDRIPTLLGDVTRDRSLWFDQAFLRAIPPPRGIRREDDPWKDGDPIFSIRRIPREVMYQELMDPLETENTIAPIFGYGSSLEFAFGMTLVSTTPTLDHILSGMSLIGKNVRDFSTSEDGRIPREFWLPILLVVNRQEEVTWFWTSRSFRGLGWMTSMLDVWFQHHRRFVDTIPSTAISFCRKRNIAYRLVTCN